MKSTVVATQGSTSYKDNIACVFGYKQLQSLLDLKPEYTPNIKENIFKGLSGEEKTENADAEYMEDVEIDLSEDSNESEVLSQQSTKSKGYKNSVCPMEFTGMISSCAHGSGRSSSDRQFYFINSRPCEPPKVSKLINDVYRQYNPHQYPFVFLNINLDRSSVDINVTPDKRKVFLTKEKVVLEVLKCSMLKLFESIPRTLKVEQLSGNFRNEVKPDVDQPRILNSFLQKFASNSSKVNGASEDIKVNSNDAELKRKSTTMLDFISAKTRRVESDESEILKEMGRYDEESIKVTLLEIEETSPLNSEDALADIPVTTSTVHVDSETENIDTHSKSPNKHHNKSRDEDTDAIIYLESDNMPNTQIRTTDDIVEKSHKIICKNKSKGQHSPMVESKHTSRTKEVVTDKEDLGKLHRRTIQIKTSLEHVKMLAEMYNNKKDTPQAPERIKFRSQINPILNPKCEEELSREISKDSFKRMTIIGQFNLGFIITKLDDDLFIIDQHATDEIYNFETLQKNTELTSQKLVW